MTNIAPPIATLTDLKTPPKNLYYKGKWDKKLFAKCAAVVGSRRMTQYGRQVIKKLIPSLVQEGATIVSGFMYGMDQEAHRECIECGGKTIAVLGWGINVPLEQSDRKLAKDIIDSGGLLVSEWEDQKATLWTFPQRNRIIAALCQEVYIVEAAQKSGSLITAQLAMQLKRKIFAIPGPITSAVSMGTNTLISQGQAQMWLPQRQLNISVTNNDPIIQLVSNESLTASEIARKLNKPVGNVGAQLSMLVLAGQIMEVEGKYNAN